MTMSYGAIDESYEHYYWNFKGRAELARILLEYGGLPWKTRDVVDWPKEKPATPFGQLPVLVIKGHDGKEIHVAQTPVISRYLASRVAGLLPSDPHARALNDMVCETALEVLEHAIQWKWVVPDSQAAWKEWKLDSLKSEQLPAFIANMTRVLEANGKAGAAGYFMAEGRLTLAELTVYYAVTSISRWIPDFINAESAPALARVVENVASHPRIKAYHASDRCPPDS